MAGTLGLDVEASAPRRSRLAAIGSLIEPARLDRWLRMFDEDPRVLGLGFLVGVAYAIIMAGNLDAEALRLSWAGVGLALVAPSAGVMMLATLVVFREPLGLNPMHFHFAVVAACALAVAVRVAIRGLAGDRTRIRPELLAIGAFGALTVIQFITVTIRVTHPRVLFALSVLTELVTGLALIVVIAVLFSPRSRRYVLAAMVPSIVIAAVVGVVSLSPELLASLPIHGWLPPLDESARGTGLFTNPNYLGQAMATGFILVARARASGLPGFLARWTWPLAALVALGVVVSFSRGAVIAVAAGILVLYAVRGRRVFLLATAGAAAFAVVGMLVLVAVRHILTWGAKIDLSGAAQAASDSMRLSVYIAGLRLFRHNWLFGVGLGQFQYESPRYVGSSPVTYPHDVFLGVAAEQGLPGIVLFLTMLIAIAVALWRIRDRVALTALAMLAAYVAGSLFADNLRTLQASAMVWIALGCGLVLPATLGEAADAAAPPVRASEGSVPESGSHLRSAGWRPRFGLGPASPDPPEPA